MDSDGYFRIVDRKKGMINVSGFKVWPKEVEEVLYEHPAINEAAAVAVPDPTSGETAKAFVVLKDEYKEKIADYKTTKVVEFKNTLPKTSVGKILRRELAQ